jgi:S-formylglutathione hydrolase FrmB
MARMLSSRRSFLTAGAGFLAAGTAGVGLVEARVLPGRVYLHTALGLTGEDGVIPAVRPGPRVDKEYASRACKGDRVRWSAAYPPGVPTDARLPVVLALHGRDNDHRFAFDELGLDRYLAAGVAAWPTPFVVVSVDGGPDSFWHRRRDGRDPQAMILTELLPQLAARGLRTERIGLIGWSMGGFGALLLAEQHPDRVATVVVSSPALWQDYADVPEGAFDGKTDFQAHDVFAGQSAFEDIRVRVDCGRDDPFVDATKAFVDGLPKRPAGGFQPGAHTAGYWRRMVPEQFEFLAWNF